MPGGTRHSGRLLSRISNCPVYGTICARGKPRRSYCPAPAMIPRSSMCLSGLPGYTERGIDYRWDFTFEDLSPAFRANPLAGFFATVFTERNAMADLQSIIYQFEAGAKPNPADHLRTSAPDLDPEWQRRQRTSARFCAQNAYSRLRDENPARCWSRVPKIQQPCTLNRYMIEFLEKCGLFPGK